MKEVNAMMKAMDKCLHNLLKVVFAMITVLSVIGMAQAGATDLTIDSQNANNGYVTINYTSTSRLKVGIRYNGGRETFLDCASGTSNFALEKGNGTYTVALYSNVAGTKYKEVTKSTVNATMKDAFAPFKVSTSEVSFVPGDSVSKKADELCKGKTESEKVVAIWNFINDKYQYNYRFADQITSGQVKQYTPDPNAVLAADKGICYDFASLFAAMCRYEKIPCKIVKGYVGNNYHAWNQVYVDGSWQKVNLTKAVCQRASVAKTIADCSAGY